MKTENINIVILEDDIYFRTDIAKSLKKYGTTFQTGNLNSFQEVITTKSIDVAFLDIDLSRHSSREGLKAIEMALENSILPVMLTGHEDKETIKEAYKLGCSYYFSKSDFQNNLDHLVTSIFNQFRPEKWQSFFSTKLITNDEKLQSQIKYLLEVSADPRQNIMILGPTGVGKSKIAKIVHESHNQGKPFVHINLSEIPENLLESQLFGHKRGAFTGATMEHTGLIEQANGGTLFLDEIGTLPVNIQKKLLRVIEDRTFSPLGSQEVIKANFRLVTATCDDLPKLIAEGDFRLDLYFRIKGIEVNVPSLKQRRCDIVSLFDFFIEKSPKKIALADDAEEALVNYDWHGNVRELENLAKELILTSKGLIQAKDLPNYILNNQNPLASQSEVEDLDNFFNHTMKEFVKKNGLPCLIKKIETECMNEWKNRCDNKTNEIIRQLQISKSLYYRINSDLEESAL